MRILLTSDLHYKLRQYDWLLQGAAQFDAVVVAGDHLDVVSAVPGEVQVAALSATLARLATLVPVLACSGNHDLNARNAAGEKIADWLDALRGPRLAVDGDSVCIAGTLFTVCPWWDGPHAQAGVRRQLEAAALRRGEATTGRWVWVYHAPPQGPLSWTGRRHYGDPLLPELVAQHSPSAVLCGHIHEAPFKADGAWAERIGTTWLFNAGQQIGDVPARIEIDFAAGTATWKSLAGVETRQLQAGQ
jgi:Icc-related predicted phosphoesterase